jgi:hypothetical protein
MITTSLLLATLASPITWDQIELNQKLVLNEPITMSEKITLNQGTKLNVSDIIPLDQIRVLSYKMKISPCKAEMKTQTSDMVIIHDLYGAQLDQECVLNVFLEWIDLHQPSLFSVLAK